MSEFTMDRLRENLEALKMKNTLEILDNYLERAVADKLNIVEVLDHIFSEEAKSKRRRAYEKQIQMSGFPIKKTLDDFDFSFQPSIDKRQIDELATMRFLENGENVVFLGPPGVGKTHLASALGRAAAALPLTGCPGCAMGGAATGDIPQEPFSRGMGKALDTVSRASAYFSLSAFFLSRSSSGGCFSFHSPNRAMI